MSDGASGAGGRRRTGLIAGLVLLLLLAGAAVALLGPLRSSPGLASLARPTPTGAASAPASATPPATASPTTAPTSTPTTASTPTPSPTTAPTPTANTSPVIASVTIPATANCGGDTNPVSVQISWVVEEATGISIAIDGPGVFETESGTTGTVNVPFACGSGDTQHTYTLTTTGGTGTPATVTKTVQRVG